MSEHQCPMCGSEGYKDGCEVCGRFRKAEVPKTIGSEIDAQTETGYLSPAEVEAKVAAGRAEALREAADALHPLVKRHVGNKTHGGPKQYAMVCRHHGFMCDERAALLARADTIATTECGDTERGRVVQSGEHRGRQKSPIASEPPVSEVAGSSPAPAHPAPASPVVSAEAVEALAAEWAAESERYKGYADGSEFPAIHRTIATTLADNAVELRALLTTPAGEDGRA